MKLNIILFLIAILYCFICCPVIFGQWVQTGGPCEGDIELLACQGQNVLAKINFGKIYLSVNLGEKWKPLNTSLKAYIYEFAIFDTNIYFCTDSGLYRQSFYDTSIVNISNFPAYKCFVSESKIYIINGTGVFFSADKGGSWKKITDGINEPIITNFFAIGSSVFITTRFSADNANGNVYVSDETGANRKTLITNIFTNSLFITDGYNIILENADNASLNIWHFDGANCSKAVCNLPRVGIKSIAANSKAIFVGTHTSGIYRSTDNGITWTFLINNLPSTDIMAIAVNGDTIYTGTSGAGVFRSLDNGKNWEKKSSGIVNSTVQKLVSAGTYIYAHTGSGLTAHDGNNVYISTNNGTDWKEITTGLPYNYSVIELAAIGTNIVAGTNGGYGLFYSTNNGSFWNPVVLDQYNRDQHVVQFCVDGMNIYALSSSNIYLSGDNGVTWKRLNYNFYNVGKIGVSNGNIFACRGQELSLSTDTGKTWSTVNSSAPWSSYWTFTNYGEKLFCWASSNIYYSDDKGRNWSKLNSSFSFDGEIQLLSIIGKNIFAATDSSLFISSDNGVTWKNITEGLPPFSDFFYYGLRGLAICGQYVYTGFVGKGVWKRPLSEITAVEKNTHEQPLDFTLNQNYPNPFNPETNISFNLPKELFVSLKIYDMLGREVATLVNEKLSAGLHSHIWNAARSSSGVYFYRLQAGEFSETKKLNVLK